MYDIKAKAAELVSKMTLEEKVSQMLHYSPAVERLGIPSYNWWNEALHGVARAGTASMFPQAIGLAAMFDEELLMEVASAISTEARAKYHAAQAEGDHDIYKGLTFWSPNINIFRDPRWGRGHETYGEDPYLTAVLGTAFIRGLQGPDRDSLKVAACAKHFAVHSGPEAERHEFNAVCDRYDLWNTYLPAFESAVREANVEIVMGAYNRTLGEPCCGSKLLLVDILRNKWGFDGHVTSDCWAIKDFHKSHMVTVTPVDSAALAISRGCDLNCGNLYGYALAAVHEGLLSEEDIDRSVTRLMVTRMRLGMLGAPVNNTYASAPFTAVDSPEHRTLNLKAARAGLVLLKNDGTLPLSFNKAKTLGVIGPNADNRRALEGNYNGTASEYITPLVGLRALAGANGARVLYAEGCHLYKDRTDVLAMPDNRISEALSVTKASDAVVLCLGLDSSIEGEEGDTSNDYAAGDKNSLDLPSCQQRLLESVVAAANGKPVILALISGSSLSIGWADEHVNGILQAFYPGAVGGQAIAETLFGMFSPQGKLPVTFYRGAIDLPDFHDYSMSNRTYRYFKGEALYPFGFGLSYGRFELSGLKANTKTCTVTIRNTGSLAAGETLQAYVSSPGQKESHNLCGFAKAYLEPNESREITIRLGIHAFSRCDANGDWQTIPGSHRLHVGFSQPDERSIRLTGMRPLEHEVIVAG